MVLYFGAIGKALLLLLCVLLGAKCLKGQMKRSGKLGKKQKKKTDGKDGHRLYAIWAVLVVIFALAAYEIAEVVPPLKDPVELTALGEKNEYSGAQEVFFNSLTVDGKTYPAEKPAAGKWFWCGNDYLVWRIETDPRQPEGVTRTITVEVPVGLNRTVNFAGSGYCGLVEVKTARGSQVIDTYSEQGQMFNVEIESSDTARLIGDQLLHLAVYAAVLAVLCLAALWLIRRALKDLTRTKDWLGRNWGRLAYAGIAIVAFTLMICLNKSSFWNDDTQEIGTVMYGFKKLFSDLLSFADGSPPLYGLFACLWYKIAPYGEYWLLLLPITTTALFVYIMGLTGEALGEKSTGILTAIIGAFSVTVWGFAAYSFRPYAFLLLFSALSLYCHIRKNQTGGERGWLIKYSAALVALSMSHYYGMTGCVLLFAWDFLLLIKKKIPKKTLLSYIAPGAAILIWLSLVYWKTLRFRSPEEIASWFEIPTLNHIHSLLKFLSGNYDFSYFLMLFGAACALAFAARALYRKKMTWARFYGVVCTGMVVLTIALMFIYGRLINPKSTMWHERYFIILLPYTTLLPALALHTIFSERDQALKGAVTLFITVVLVINCVVVGPSSGGNQAYATSADWIYTDINSIFNPDCAIIYTSFWPDAYESYYIEKQGRRDPLTVQHQWYVTEEWIAGYNRLYVQYSQAPIEAQLQTILDRDFVLETARPDLQTNLYVRRQ